jgi:hypothetical protein
MKKITNGDPEASLAARASVALDNARLRQRMEDMLDALRAAFPTNYEVRNE